MVAAAPSVPVAPIAKAWEVGAAWETHRLIVQNDLAGAANNKLLNQLFAYVRYELGSRDALELRAWFYQRLLADPGETGLRSDDLTLYYAHYFKGLGPISGRVFANLTAPTSFSSRLASSYTSPRLGTAWQYQVGRWTASIIGMGDYYWVKYSSMAGGNPNAKAHVGLIAEAECALTPTLAIGATAVGHRYWFYEARGDPSVNSTFFGAVDDPQFRTQPVQGSYGYQVFGRYTLPTQRGVATDITLAYGQGDPTLGYTSSLHDGLSHFYWFWRQSSQVYAAVSVKY